MPPAGQQPIAVKLAIELTVCLLRQNKVKETNAVVAEFVRRASVYSPEPKKTDTPAQQEAARTATEQLAVATTQLAYRFIWADQWAETETWSDRAAGQWVEFYKRWPVPSGTALQTRETYWLKALALNWQGKGKEAVEAADEAIRVSSEQDESELGKRSIRMLRARFVAKAGDHTEAVRHVKAELAAGNTNTWDAALAYSLCVKAAKGDEKLQEEYAKEGVALLRKTLDAKGFGYPWRKDVDLNPIRDRADFKAVFAEFEKQSALNR